MISRVGKRPFQAEETVGISWEHDKNLSRQCSLGLRVDDSPDSVQERSQKMRGQDRTPKLAKGICVLFKMRQRIRIALKGMKRCQAGKQKSERYLCRRLDTPHQLWLRNMAVGRCERLQCFGAQVGPLRE